MVAREMPLSLRLLRFCAVDALVFKSKLRVSECKSAGTRCRAISRTKQGERLSKHYQTSERSYWMNER